MKGNSTCPMCRTNICFRGFTHSVNKWRQEKEEQRIQEVFADAVDYLLVDEEPSDGSVEDPPLENVREYSPEPMSDGDDDDDSEWSDGDSDFEFDFDMKYFLNPPNKIQQLIEMEKKFNNFKDEYDAEDLLEIVVHPYYVLCKSNDPFEYPPVIKTFVKQTPLKITGLSQKRRRQVQTHGDAPCVIQLLEGQFVLVL